ncbi:MAG: histidinol-phosphate transaminase [Clostridia bacterium]|nr:histidinol-phosphate transaminase [Clostridia bacterium]
MNKYIPEKIAKLDEYIPDNGKYDIRVDANESPFLPSEAMKKDMENAFSGLAFNRYPDSEASCVKRAFAEVYGLDADCVVAGNGSDELISVIAATFLSPGDKVLVVLPDFSMYEFYSKISGAEVVRYEKHSDFSVDFDDISRVVAKENIKMVIFSNPCNPTGRAYDRETIDRFLDTADTLIVVDEAYMEFCTADASVLGEYKSRDNLIVLKTLSKAFGLAAMRCGFAVSNRELITAIKKVKSPYNVNSATQAVAAAVLSHVDEIKENTSAMVRERQRMEKELTALSEKYSFKVYRSDTNFVFMHIGVKSREIYSYLADRSVKIRLMGEYLRITASYPEETDRVMSALRAAFSAVYGR